MISILTSDMSIQGIITIWITESILINYRLLHFFHNSPQDVGSLTIEGLALYIGMRGSFASPTETLRKMSSTSA